MNHARVTVQMAAVNSMCVFFFLASIVASVQTFPSSSRLVKPPPYSISISFDVKEPEDVHVDVQT